MASPSLRKTLFLKHKVLVPSFLFKGAILHQQCFMRGDELQPQHWEITAASSSTTSLIHTSSWCVLECIRNWNTACSVVLEARILDFSLNLPTFLRHNQGQRNTNGLHTRLGPTVCVPQASAGEPCSVLMAVLHFQKTRLFTANPGQEQAQFGEKMFNSATFLMGRNFLILLAKIVLIKPVSTQNAQVIASILFQKHKRQLYTWTSPESQCQNHIDYILCSWRWRSSTQSTKTRLGADCGSVHELLIVKFRLNLKKVGKTTRSFRYDVNT